MAPLTAPAQARSRVRSRDWYATPLYYDIVFDADTELEGTFLEAVLARHGTSGGRRVLEPACGSGRLVAALARRSFEVTGFDQSGDMLAFARRRLARGRLRAELGQADLAHFSEGGPFDLAHCLVSTFKYLLDEERAVAHLTRVARALAPGGVYVLGVHLTEYAWRGRLRERWVARRGPTRVVCNIQTWPADRARRLERVRSRLLVSRGATRRALETNWLFRTYDAAELSRLIAEVPELELVATYDFSYDLATPRELDGDQLDCVLVLRRRSKPSSSSASRRRSKSAQPQARQGGRQRDKCS